jgi:hypothetical protein
MERRLIVGYPGRRSFRRPIDRLEVRALSDWEWEIVDPQQKWQTWTSQPMSYLLLNPTSKSQSQPRMTTKINRVSGAAGGLISSGGSKMANLFIGTVLLRAVFVGGGGGGFQDAAETAHHGWDGGVNATDREQNA